MALPTSGELAMARINQELRRAASSQISLDTAENGGYVRINRDSPSRPNASNPAAISEWYGYDHTYVDFGTHPLIGIGYDARSADRACENAENGLYTIVWGDQRQLIDCVEIYINQSADDYMPRGWYAEGAFGFVRYWTGYQATFPESRECFA